VEATAYAVGTIEIHMTKNVRLIARLDVKGENLIKGVHLEGLRVIGDPQTHAISYYHQGADELLYVDIVASLYGRSKLSDIVRRTAHEVFVPLTVCGGIRSLEDVSDLLLAGADKVAINTAAVKRPELITEIARRYGSQCMVLSIEAKRQSPDRWEVYTDCGREGTGIDVVDWVKRSVGLGAGEILLTSIDMEGTRKGFDCNLVEAITAEINLPVIASGGYGEPSHLKNVVGVGADAVAIADGYHYKRTTVHEVRQSAMNYGIPVRNVK